VYLVWIDKLLKIEFLRQIPYFAELDAANPSLLELAKFAREEKYERGQLIFMEGEMCQGLYYLFEGQIRIFKSEPGGREQILRIVGAGETFNEVALLDGKSLPASAEALTNSIVWLIPTEAVLKLLDLEPKVARAIMMNLANQLRQLTDLVAEISLKQVTARIARLLLEQAQSSPILGIGISKNVTSQFTQQQMASMAGTVREMVGRALRTLQKAGAIKAYRGHIIILDQDKLKRFL